MAIEALRAFTAAHCAMILLSAHGGFPAPPYAAQSGSLKLWPFSIVTNGNFAIVSSARSENSPAVTVAEGRKAQGRRANGGRGAEASGQQEEGGSGRNAAEYTNLIYYIYKTNLFK